MTRPGTEQNLCSSRFSIAQHPMASAWLIPSLAKGHPSFAHLTGLTTSNTTSKARFIAISSLGLPITIRCCVMTPAATVSQTRSIRNFFRFVGQRPRGGCGSGWLGPIYADWNFARRLDCYRLCRQDPDRISHLIIYGGYARGLLHRGNPEKQEHELDLARTLIREGWGSDQETYRQFFTSRNEA